MSFPQVRAHPRLHPEGTVSGKAPLRAPRNDDGLGPFRGLAWVFAVYVVLLILVAIGYLVATFF